MIIKGSLNLKNSSVEFLKDIEIITEDLNLGGCKNLKSLGKLQKVNGDLNLFGCKNLKSLGKLKTVKKLFIDDCKSLIELPENFDDKYLVLLFAVNSGITQNYLKKYFPRIIKEDKVVL